MSTCTLPNRDEMMTALRGVVDDAYLEQHLYPHLLEHAGEEVTQYSAYIVILEPIIEFVSEEGTLPIVVSLVMDSVPYWIDALLDNDRLATEVKSMFEQFKSASTN